jgi:hypothetical protein
VLQAAVLDGPSGKVLFATSGTRVTVLNVSNGSTASYDLGPWTTLQAADLDGQPGQQQLLATNGSGNPIIVLAIVSVATHFSVAGPSTATAGSAFSITVVATDSSSHQDIDYRGTVRFRSTDGQAILPSDYTFTAADGGRHTFTGVALRSAGNQAVTVVDTASSGVSGNLTLSVSPAAASRYDISAPGSSTAGAAFTVTVTARDSFNNLVPDYRGSVRLSSSDDQATLPGDYAFTAADAGSHTFTGAVLRTAGSQTLTGRDTGAGFSASLAVNVSPAAASRFDLSGPASSTAGTAFDLTVTARDPYNNVATGYAGTAHFSSTDGRATLPPDSALTNGTGTFSATLFTAGPQSVVAADTADGSLAGGAPVTVVAAAADHFVVATTAANPDVAGTDFDVTVTAQDAYGNTDTGYAGTAHFSSTDPYARLPADYTFGPTDAGVATFAAGAALYVAGPQNVTAAAVSGISGAAAVTVVAAPAAFFYVVAPAGASAGSAFDVTVYALDPYGNVDTNYGGTVAFSTSDGDPGVVLPASYTFQTSDGGVVTFAAGVTLVTAGDQTLTVTDLAGGISGTATVTVTSPGPPPAPAGGSAPGRDRPGPDHAVIDRLFSELTHRRAREKAAYAAPADDRP